MALPNSSRWVEFILDTPPPASSSSHQQASTLYIALGGASGGATGGGEAAGGGEEAEPPSSALVVDLLHSVAMGLDDLLSRPPSLPAASLGGGGGGGGGGAGVGPQLSPLTTILRALCPSLTALQRAVDDEAATALASAFSSSTAAVPSLATLGSLLRMPSLALGGSGGGGGSSGAAAAQEELVQAGRGCPGAPLTALDARRLTLSPLAVFRRGQIVAWAPAAAVGEGGGTGSASGSASSGSATTTGTLPPWGTLVYARVEGVGASPWGAVTRLLLNRGGAGAPFVSAMSSAVYCFKPASALTDFLGEGEGEREEGMEEVEEELGLIALPVPSQRPTPTPAAAAAPPIYTAPAAAAPVTEAETLEALNALLARLSLPPLGASAAASLGDSLSLRSSRDSAVKELSALKKEVVGLRASCESLRSAWNCPICFARDVDTVLAPCGHTICASCLASLPGQPAPQCPFDRRPVSGAIKLFKPA